MIMFNYLAGLTIFMQTGFSIPLMEPGREIYRNFYSSFKSYPFTNCSDKTCTDKFKSIWKNGFSLDTLILDPKLK